MCPSLTGPRAILGCVALTLLTLTACCRPPEPPRQGTLHRDEVFDFGGASRTYHFYETARSGDRPLVLLLHGGGGTIDNHIGLGQTSWPHQVWLDLADEEGLHLLVPQGLSSQWNDCRTDCDHCGEQDDAGFLVALIDDLGARYDIDQARLYVVGESNGGLMTLRLAQEHPERFAAAGVVIALMPANTECTSPSELPISLMFQVGTADTTVPYAGGLSSNPPTGSFLSAEATLDHWVAQDRCAPTSRTTTIPDLDPDDGSRATREDYDCPETGTALAMVRLEGAGHVPPSVEVQVSAFWESLVGEQSHDLEGARVFWDFFRDRSRPPGR